MTEVEGQEGSLRSYVAACSEYIPARVLTPLNPNAFAKGSCGPS